MKPLRYALYPPFAPELPWLAVALRGDKPVEVFGFSERHQAARALGEIQARLGMKLAKAHT